nr:hypothetical protein GCM10020092_005800 [Actinoplanes digitatis]
MIRRLLVANRGEIARRVFSTCRLVGIETVAVYSDADSDAQHVTEADYAVHLSGGTAASTYLRGDLIIAAARRAGANAIHPGDGALAEDPEFAAAVADAGMIWVGPPAKTLGMLHSKIETKAVVAEAGVPVLPTATDPEQITDFPVLIKPDSGRGGQGMRVVRDPHTLAEAVASTRQEIGDEIFCEPYVENVRHIEVPIIADTHGAVVPFGERECSVQRRYQKIIEETPSPAVDPALREELCRAAIIAVRAIGYVGAGAVEFLLDSEGDFWFLELTPSLQVEHAVTECVSGYDLVRLQLLVSEGGHLPMPGPPPIRGHAIEVRICAEDPAYAWLPASGTLHRFGVPDVAGSFRPLPQPGLRLDTGVTDGSVVGLQGDSMLAKLVAWAPTRQEAARMLASALTRTQLHGVVTNRDLLVRVLRHQAFRAGDVDTGFLDRHPEVFAPLLSSVDAVRISCLAAALAGCRRPAGDRARARLAALGLAQRAVRLADRRLRRPGQPGRGRLPDEPARRAGRLVGALGGPGGAGPRRPRPGTDARRPSADDGRARRRRPGRPRRQRDPAEPQGAPGRRHLLRGQPGGLGDAAGAVPLPAALAGGHRGLADRPAARCRAPGAGGAGPAGAGRRAAAHAGGHEARTPGARPVGRGGRLAAGTPGSGGRHGRAAGRPRPRVSPE